MTARFLLVALLVGSSAHAMNTRCCSFDATDDLWDVSQGVVITDSSGFGAAPGENMFGDTQASPEPGVAFFRDDRVDGFVHFVEWQTPQPVSVRSISLFAAHDQNSLQRSFKQFNLYAFDPNSSTFELVLAFTPSLPYGGGSEEHLLFLCTDVTETTSDRFRAEFVQNGGFAFPGPRIFELDGYSEPQHECVCVPPPPGMVAWWPGDGNAGDVAGGNHGDPQPSVTFPDGVVDRAFGFDGIGAFVHVPDSDSLDITNAITIDAWIKPLSAGGAQGTTFVMLKGDNFAANTQSYGLLWGGGGETQSIALRLGNETKFDELGVVIPLGQFTHVAGTYDGTTMRLYTNGTEAASKQTDLGALQNTGAPLIIGSSLRSGSLEEFFHGLVDELELFDRALSAEEIAAIFHAGSAGKCKDEAVELSCSLAPAEATNPVDELHSVTVTVTLDGVPVRASVSFSVTGANSAASTGHLTDENGEAEFTYVGHVAGTDTIRATAALGELSTACTATKVWIAPSAGTHDLAVIGVKAPRRINLKGASPSLTKRVKVRIQNLGDHAEAISLAALANLLTVDVHSLGDERCEPPVATLINGPPNKAKLLKPNKKLNVFFTVTYTCANDAAKGAGHEDYRYAAAVHHEALGTGTDTNPGNDVCPRAGCSAPTTDVFVKPARRSARQ